MPLLKENNKKSQNSYNSTDSTQNNAGDFNTESVENRKLNSFGRNVL